MTHKHERTLFTSGPAGRTSCRAGTSVPPPVTRALMY
jgi:hypothetical protein